MSMKCVAYKLLSAVIDTDDTRAIADSRPQTWGNTIDGVEYETLDINSMTANCGVLVRSVAVSWDSPWCWCIIQHNTDSISLFYKTVEHGALANKQAI